MSIKKILFMVLAIVFVSCGQKTNKKEPPVAQDSIQNNIQDSIQNIFQDYVQESDTSKEDVNNSTVTQDNIELPSWFTREDSIAYFENLRCESPISVETFLSLAEIHAVEENCFNYNNPNPMSAWGEDIDPESYVATYRDSCAFKLANRMLRMRALATTKGDASDMLNWAIATDYAIDEFCTQVPELSPDMALKDILRVIDEFSSNSQSEMNYYCYVSSIINYYRTIKSYLGWLNDLPDDLKPLAQDEYTAWFLLNEERYTFWRDISYKQEQNSMIGTIYAVYYSRLAENRAAELALEHDIVLKGKTYRQMGKDVTPQQWEEWLAEHSVPEDAEELLDWGNSLPDPEMVAEKAGSLHLAYNRWSEARQAFAAALPKAKKEAYEHLTSDIQSRFVGQLEWQIPFGE